MLEGLPHELKPVISVIESKFESILVEEVEALLHAHEMLYEKLKKSSIIENASINLTQSKPLPESFSGIIDTMHLLMYLLMIVHLCLLPLIIDLP